MPLHFIKRSPRNARARILLLVTLLLLPYKPRVRAQVRPDTALQHDAWGTAEGLPQDSAHAIAQTPDGFLWIATEAGLARFDGYQFRVSGGQELGPSASEDLCCLAVDGNGVLWIGSSLGVAAFDHSRRITLPDRPPFTGQAIRQLSVSNGRAVVRTDAGAFLVRASGEATRADASLPVSSAGPEMLDRYGERWIGSSDGLRLMDRAGRTIAVRSLARQSVLSLAEDAEGDIWVGTETSGVHRLRRSMFRTRPGSEGIAATAVAWSPGGALLGTRQGELLLLPEAAKPRVLARFEGAVTALVSNGAFHWVGTTDGLYRLDNGGRTQRFTSENGLPDDYIQSLAGDVAGGVWVGTAHGLAHIVDGRVTTLGFTQGPGSNAIGALLPIKQAGGGPDAVWVATEAGVSLIEGSQVIRSLHLANSVVAGMAFDAQGTLWLATSDGWLWNQQTGAPRKVLRLPTDKVRRALQSIAIDAHGTFWLVLRDGVLSGSVERLRQCTPGTCESMTPLFARWGVADGMPSEESLPGATGPPVPDDHDELLFATRAGIAVADSAATSRITQVPAMIDDVVLEGSPLETSRLQSIPYGRTHVTIDYTGISLGQSSRIRYRILLHGFDREWIETGVRRSASYTSLPPGPYEFEVEAVLEGQPWPAAGARIGFRIAPPFYRRWWFLLLSALLCVALILLVYQLRLRAERRHFAIAMNERNRLAREVHDTLAQDLVSTGIQLDVILFSLAQQPHAPTMELLRTLRRRVTQALADARESIGELRDPHLRLDLPSRLRSLAERKSTRILKIVVEADGDPKPLKPSVELELLRIVGEGLSNALRHAGAQSILIRLEARRDVLVLTVKDDGSGFNASGTETLTGHYGLQGMRERAEAIGADLFIRSAPGQGTTIEVSVRYPR